MASSKEYSRIFPSSALALDPETKKPIKKPLMETYKREEELARKLQSEELVLIVKQDHYLVQSESAEYEWQVKEK